jgi:hypothetical protein
LFLIKLSTLPYFIWKMLCRGTHPSDQINLNHFEKYLNKSKRGL